MKLVTIITSNLIIYRTYYLQSPLRSSGCKEEPHDLSVALLCCTEEGHPAILILLVHWGSFLDQLLSRLKVSFLDSSGERELKRLGVRHQEPWRFVTGAVLTALLFCFME